MARFLMINITATLLGEFGCFVNFIFMLTVLLFVLRSRIILPIFIDFYFWVLINFDKFNIIEA